MTTSAQARRPARRTGADRGSSAKSKTRAIATCDLTECPDQEELRRLQAFLVENRDAEVGISAARLRRPDTLLLQLLLAARRDWEARGVAFRLLDPPAPLVEALPRLGLRPEMIGIEVAP